jgi:hypothetical protein
MQDDRVRRERAKGTLLVIGWCIGFGLCVVAWEVGLPRLVRGVQAWQTGGAEETVVYERGWYKGAPTGGGSESARSAVQGGLGWCAAGALMSGGLVCTFVVLRRRWSKPVA